MSVNLKHEAQLKQEQMEKNNKKLNIATWTKKTRINIILQLWFVTCSKFFNECGNRQVHCEQSVIFVLMTSKGPEVI